MNGSEMLIAARIPSRPDASSWIDAAAARRRRVDPGAADPLGPDLGLTGVHLPGLALLHRDLDPWRQPVLPGDDHLVADREPLFNEGRVGFDLGHGERPHLDRRIRLYDISERP